VFFAPLTGWLADRHARRDVPGSSKNQLQRCR
jgi:hypothetical protein